MVERDTGSGGSGGGGDGGSSLLRDLQNTISGILGSGDEVEMTPEEQNQAALELAGLSEEQNRVLSSFARRPVGFVLGIILSEVLSGIEAVTTAFVSAISLVLVGSGPGTSGEYLGLADIPLYLGELVVGIVQPTGEGETIGGAIISIAEIPVGVVVDFAGRAGPLEPVVLATGAAGGIIAVAWLLRQLLVLGADAVPGAEVLLP